MTKNTASILKVLQSLNCIDHDGLINKDQLKALGLFIVDKGGILTIKSKICKQELEFGGTQLDLNRRIEVCVQYPVVKSFI